MADTKTPKELLIVAIQDLYDAERALIDRGKEPEKACEDGALSALLKGYSAAAKDRAKSLERVAKSLDAKPRNSPNIWMRAVLDDAARDASTIVRGPLRDIALAGALRKGAQAARVSYITALLLARRLRRTEDAKALAALRDAHAEADRQLTARLAALVRTLGR